MTHLSWLTNTGSMLYQCLHCIDSVMLSSHIEWADPFLDYGKFKAEEKLILKTESLVIKTYSDTHISINLVMIKHARPPRIL